MSAERNSVLVAHRRGGLLSQISKQFSSAVSEKGVKPVRNHSPVSYTESKLNDKGQEMEDEKVRVIDIIVKEANLREFHETRTNLRHDLLNRREPTTSQPFTALTTQTFNPMGNHNEELKEPGSRNLAVGFQSATNYFKYVEAERKISRN